MQKVWNFKNVPLPLHCNIKKNTMATIIDFRTGTAPTTNTSVTAQVEQVSTIEAESRAQIEKRFPGCTIESSYNYYGFCYSIIRTKEGKFRPVAANGKPMNTIAFTRMDTAKQVATNTCTSIGAEALNAHFNK